MSAIGKDAILLGSTPFITRDRSKLIPGILIIHSVIHDYNQSFPETPFENKSVNKFIILSCSATSDLCDPQKPGCDGGE